MQRRGRSGQPEKGRRANRPKARKAPSRHASSANLQNKFDQLTRELNEARQRETATSEVLKVINSSPGELKPVFQAMLENATKLCDAGYGTMWLAEGQGFRAAAQHGSLPAVSTEKGKSWSGRHFQPRADVPLARCARTRAP